MIWQPKENIIYKLLIQYMPPFPARLMGIGKLSLHWPQRTFQGIIIIRKLIVFSEV